MCNEKREKLFILLSSLSAVFQVRSYLTFSVFRRCVSHWKVHKPPGQACSVEMPAWQATLLCLDLHYTLMNSGWMPMFKAEVHFPCQWQLDGGDLSSWSFTEIALANLLSELPFDSSHFLYLNASYHRHLNSVKVHQVVITQDEDTKQRCNNMV